VGAAQRARHLAQVDPAVDAARVERVGAVAQPPHLVRRLQPLQAHPARRLRPRPRPRRRSRHQLQELDEREPLLHRLRPRGFPAWASGRAVDDRRVVLGVVGELVEAEEAEHQHEHQRHGVEELEQRRHGARHRVAVADQREGHDRRGVHASA